MIAKKQIGRYLYSNPTNDKCPSSKNTNRQANATPITIVNIIRSQLQIKNIIKYAAANEENAQATEKPFFIVMNPKKNGKAASSVKKK